MNHDLMGTVFKNDGLVRSSPYLGGEDHRTTPFPAVRRTTADHPGPPPLLPRHCRDTVVRKRARTTSGTVLKKWSAEWSCGKNFCGPLLPHHSGGFGVRWSGADEEAQDRAGDLGKAPHALVHVRPSTISTRRTRDPLTADVEVTGWTLGRSRCPSGPRWASGDGELDKGTSTIWSSPQVSAAAWPWCHKTVHKAVENGEKSAQEVSEHEQ